MTQLANRIPIDRKEVSTAIGLGVWLLLLMSFVHQQRFDGPTAVSRLNLLHALVQEGRVCIDTWHTNTPDKAVFEGRYFSDKAPGTVAVALPVFAVAAWAGESLGVETNSKAGWLGISWVACVWSQALPGAIGGALLFLWLQSWVPPRAAFITVAAIFLGAAPLPYATMMYSHTLVVGLLAMFMWVMGRIVNSAATDPISPADRATVAFPAPPSQGDPRGDSPKSTQSSGDRWLAVGAGFCLGLALASGFTVGIIAVGLVAWFWLERRWRALVPLALGAIPPLLLIPLYSFACFGNPFILPYSLQAAFPAIREGLYAIKWPDTQTAYNLLFSPTRELFFWTPFLVMAGFDYGELLRRSPRLFWLTYLLPLLQVLVISGRVWDWQAGPTLGPRYLAPILPLLALPCALGVQRWPKPGLILAAYSIGITTLATLTDASPNGHIYNPLTDLHVPRALNAELSPNLGLKLGLPPFASVCCFYGFMVLGGWWIGRRTAK